MLQLARQLCSLGLWDSRLTGSSTDRSDADNVELGRPQCPLLTD